MRVMDQPAVAHHASIAEWVKGHPEYACLLEEFDREVQERLSRERMDKSWHLPFLKRYKATPVTFWLSREGPGSEEAMLAELRELSWCHVEDTRKFAQARRWPGYPDFRLSKPPSVQPLWVEFKANGDALRVEQLAALPSWSDVLVVAPKVAPSVKQEAK